MSAALTLDDATVALLNEQFTHSYHSAASYLFEAQAYEVEGDGPLLEALELVREDDRRHAKLLANIIQLYDRVPESGSFPYWYRDLNYLTVPYMADFVVECLEKDLARYDAAAASTPEDLRLVHATLREIRKEKAERLEALRPLVAEAKARERQAYADEAAAIRKVREDREAKEKAGAEAARKAKAAAKAAEKAAVAADPAAGMPDPNEPGISAKEKAKRTMMIKRAKAKAAKEAPAAAPAADPTAGMPDPNEPGISAKEKAKRTMMIKRAKLAAQKEAEAPSGTDAKPAPAADPSTGSGPDGDSLLGLPDPDEEGISNKEKAKRTMMLKRAQKRAQDASAAPAEAPLPRADDAATDAGSDPAASSGPDGDPSTSSGSDDDPLLGLPDPNEAGISNKEKAKRTMMLKRAQKKKADGS